MIEKALHFLSIAGARAVPGLINLACLLFIGSRLSIAEFGLYSTFLVSTNLLASLAYGSVQFSIVSSHAKEEAEGRAVAYESSILLASCLVTLALALVSIALLSYSDKIWLGLCAVVSFGVLQVLQELLRARLQFMAYSASAILQAAVFILLIYGGLQTGEDSTTAIEYFALSNMAAILLVLSVARFKLARPSLALLVSVRTVGFPYTLSTLSENALFVGFRYLLLLFGTPAQLGVFSFCVDLAQRSVGFVINVAGFIVVPRAFKREQETGKPLFHRELIVGAAVSGTLALAVLSAVVVADNYLGFTHWGVDNFGALTFSIVGLAVIVNRTKKLLLDPILMRNEKVSYLIGSYMVGALLAVPLAVFALLAGHFYLFELSYLFGYLVAAAFIMGLLFRDRAATRGHSIGTL